MATNARPLGLYFDPDGYVELTSGTKNIQSQAVGLMGRQVAGKEFLDALLKYSTHSAIEAVCRSTELGEPLREIAKAHPSATEKPRQIRVTPEAEFCRQPAAELLYFPCPPMARLAWARQAIGGGRFAMCGVTHTTCTPNVMHGFAEMITAPFEPFDALICSSRSVLSTVKAVTGHHTEYLRERFGGQPTFRPRLEVIPLGVNHEKYHPATPEERRAARQTLSIHDDEVMVLCVGRLSHHAKAHPFPVWAAVEQAAQRTKQRIHLVFAGWAANAAIEGAFKEGARIFAPSVRVSFLDGQIPVIRANVWPAADIFVSLPDNIQETFGLVVTEAMACGLPVVGSEWDGYRDMLLDGETGFAVPTMMIPGATSLATTRLTCGGINYDQYLAHASQVVTVDIPSAANAVTKLVADPALRQRMGANGRQRVLQHFTWERVIAAYEALWAEQQRELAKYQRPTKPVMPARMPPPELAFATYPTMWMREEVRCQAGPEAAFWLRHCVSLPITNVQYVPRHRDEAVLLKVLNFAAEPRSFADMVNFLSPNDPSSEVARSTLGWLFKYGLLRVLASGE